MILEAYSIGIIDFLQLWNAEKGAEKFVKQILGKDAIGISAVEPLSYGKRFLAAMEARFTAS